MSRRDWYRSLGGMRPAARSYVGSGLPAQERALRGRRFRVLRSNDYPDAVGQVGECREAHYDSRRRLFVLDLIMQRGEEGYPEGWLLRAATCDAEEELPAEVPFED